MFHLRKKLALIFFAVILTITACQNIKEPVIENATESNPPLKTTEIPTSILPNGCIAPIETFAYSVEPQDDPISIPKVLPSSPWQRDAAFPDNWERPQLLAARSQNDLTELWILVDQSLEPGAIGVFKFAIYYPKSSTWKTIPAEIGNTGIYVYKLLVTRDGSIYGVAYLGKSNKTPGISILSKFNEKSQAFEFIPGAQDIPSSSPNDSQISSQVMLDVQSEIFWVLVPGDAIYSYNTITQESKKHISLPLADAQNFLDVTLSQDGKIYSRFYNNSTFSNSNNDFLLYRFEIATESIERLVIRLEPWPIVSEIFADHTGRLWFGGVGWMEPDGRWYQMVPSPLFITNVRWSGLDYRWKSPEILMESTDNRLWFKLDYNGMFWIDPGKPEWCWFTTYSSNIVEDPENNLWLIADGHLYKSPLQP